MVRHKSFIIGCGKIAGVYDNLDDQFVYSHAAAYTKHKHVDIVGCWDLKIKNSSKLSEKYKIDAYDCSYIDAIKITKPDIVSICTPEKTHFEFVMSILESDFIPKIIFLEKPVCSNENQLNSLINARAENLLDRPSFKEAFLKRRCLVIADGFYEWKTEYKTNQPYRIHLKNDKAFAFAGIWQVWNSPDGERLVTCAIVTTEAGDDLAKVHQREPVTVR